MTNLSGSSERYYSWLLGNNFSNKTIVKLVATMKKEAFRGRSLLPGCDPTQIFRLLHKKGTKHRRKKNPLLRKSLTFKTRKGLEYRRSREEETSFAPQSFAPLVQSYGKKENYTHKLYHRSYSPESTDSTYSFLGNKPPLP